MPRDHARQWRRAVVPFLLRFQRLGWPDSSLDNLSCLAVPGSLYGPTSCWMLPFCDDSFSSSRASPQKLNRQPGRWIFRSFLFDRPGVLPAVAEGLCNRGAQGGSEGCGRNGKIGWRVSRSRPPPSPRPSGHPTSAVRGLDPSAGRGTLAALLGVMLFQLFDTFNLRDNIGIWG
jgi:hypothetical protein